MDETGLLILKIVTTIFVGMSKAGFGAGSGIVAGPILAAFVMPADRVLGFLLPFVLVADVFALSRYRASCNLRIVMQLVPGAVLGVLLGGFVLREMPVGILSKTLGVLALSFGILQFWRNQHSEKFQAYVPKAWHGMIVGIGVGVVSTLAHVGGVLTTMFLLPQRLTNQALVGTAAVVYLIINFVKSFVYWDQNVLNMGVIKEAVLLMPALVIGIALGFHLNKKLSPAIFSKFILVVVVIAGLKLILN